jgi:hypothetical protein
LKGGIHLAALPNIPRPHFDLVGVSIRIEHIRQFGDSGRITAQECGVEERVVKRKIDLFYQFQQVDLHLDGCKI